MQGWDGSYSDGVGHTGEGCVIHGWGGVGHEGVGYEVGWVIQGWGVSYMGGVGGSCSVGWVGHVGV